jgi:DMSO reductase anchor subunit
MTGALWFDAIANVFDQARIGLRIFACLSILAALAIKLGYWHFIDHNKSGTTAESATGLGHLGKVRLFEAPHTSDNYLMKEMGFRIARKHAAKLRWIAVVFGFLVPLALSGLAIAAPGIVAIFASVVAALLATIGVLVERWLFFAEAKHVVTLYYGRGV